MMASTAMGLSRNHPSTYILKHVKFSPCLLVQYKSDRYDSGTIGKSFENSFRWYPNHIHPIIIGPISSTKTFDASYCHLVCKVSESKYSWIFYPNRRLYIHSLHFQGNVMLKNAETNTSDATNYVNTCRICMIFIPSESS